MVSVAVSKMGVAGLFFVKPGCKRQWQVLPDVLVSQHILSDIRHVASDNFMLLAVQRTCTSDA